MPEPSAAIGVLVLPVATRFQVSIQAAELVQIKPVLQGVATRQADVLNFAERWAHHLLYLSVCRY